MTRIFIFLFIALAFYSCNNTGPTQQQYDQLKNELDSCKKLIAELQNTPQQRLTNGLKSSAEKDYSTAISQFQEIVTKFPGTDEADRAAKEMTAIKNLIQKQKEADERKRALGYKALSESTKVKVNNLQLSFSKASISSQWTFDSYGDEYRYRQAERGNRYITARVSIKSESKNPSLPPILVYKIQGGELRLVGTMGYEFARWEDFASYLGNNADYGNDFAHSSTIPFSCGIQIANSDIDNEAVFIVVKKTNCFSRIEDRFGRPPVQYRNTSCDVKQSLTVEDFNSEYTVVKIFNKNRI